jgi:RES domain
VNLLALDVVSQRSLAFLRITRRLSLVRLAGPGLARAGATAEVTHAGLPYDVPQTWSKAIYGLAHNFDGIAYNARHDDEQLCYALFDRAQDAIVEDMRIVDLDNVHFWEVADHYDVGLGP